MLIKQNLDLRVILKDFGRKEIVNGTVASVGSQKGAPDYIIIDLMTGAIMDFKYQSDKIGSWVGSGLTDVNVEEPKEVLNIIKLGSGHEGICPVCNSQVIYAGDRKDCNCRVCSQSLKWDILLI